MYYKSDLQKTQHCLRPHEEAALQPSQLLLSPKHDISLASKPGALPFAACLLAVCLLSPQVKSHSLRWTFKGPAIGHRDASGLLGPVGGERQQAVRPCTRQTLGVDLPPSPVHHSGHLLCLPFVNTSTYLLVPLLIPSCYSRGMTLTHPHPPCIKCQRVDAEESVRMIWQF